MIRIRLKRLIYKKEVCSIINDLINSIGEEIVIKDSEGRILLGNDNGNSPQRYPVEVEGEVIGWVIGEEKITPLATLLSHLANKEYEKKALAKETLEKYKEISLLYRISEKISANLNAKQISDLIIDEAQKLINADNISVMLVNENSDVLEILAAFGNEYNPKMNMQSGMGIAGYVLEKGKAEIVNDVLSDPRYIVGANKVSSMMCAPLKIKDQVLGVINLSSEKPVSYTAGDLKLFTALASQAASAIENAILHENKLKEERMRSNLGRYLAPQIVQAIIETKEDIPLNPVKSKIAILFSDIRNFTTTCEDLEPEEIVEYLNEYFTHLVDIIFKHGGTVNKFVGDMIFALFGVPSKFVDYEKRAIEAAIEMQECIKTMPVVWIRDHFSTGIGINSGEVVVGNIGSPQHMDYTAIGDEVNIAARLESIAKSDQILVSSDIYDATKDIFDFEDMGDLKVKGKKKTVKVFKVLH